jgi:hypothetical protein
VIEESKPAFVERHYSAAEIAALWGLSVGFVRRFFEKEPGVVVFESPRAYGRRRRYRTLRIPESVIERVHRRLALKGNGRAA